MGLGVERCRVERLSNPGLARTPHAPGYRPLARWHRARMDDAGFRELLRAV